MTTTSKYIFKCMKVGKLSMPKRLIHPLSVNLALNTIFRPTPTLSSQERKNEKCIIYKWKSTKLCHLVSVCNFTTWKSSGMWITIFFPFFSIKNLRTKIIRYKQRQIWLYGRSMSLSLCIYFSLVYFSPNVRRWRYIYIQLCSICTTILCICIFLFIFVRIDLKLCIKKKKTKIEKQKCPWNIKWSCVKFNETYTFCKSPYSFRSRISFYP